MVPDDQRFRRSRRTVCEPEGHTAAKNLDRIREQDVGCGRLFFTNVNYDNLECVTLVYDDYELSREASRQRHIYKTRELIFSESHVTAAPVLQAPYSVMATIPKSLLDSEPFRQLLEAMELRVCSRQRALPQDFQTCLTYTMVALVAPAWNKVGRYLCQGRDFLVADDVIPAIGLSGGPGIASLCDPIQPSLCQ
ncbi:hypothetical protein MRX96_008769 [Rhipicephalus microplus]